MKRRNFLRHSVASSVITLGVIDAIAEKSVQNKKYNFKLNYAPHFGMFENHAGKDLIDQIKFMSEQGFTAIEDNDLPNRPIDIQEKIGNALAKYNMKMGVFVVGKSEYFWNKWLTTGKKEHKEQFIISCKIAIETAKRVNAKWMTVVPGFYSPELPIGIQTSNVIENLRIGAEIFEPHGLIMVLEPLSDTPELFLRNSDQTYMICKAVKSNSCKILYDIYHMQRNEGNIIDNINLTWDEIAYFQIGDNPGRNEPTSGEINYKNIFKLIHSKGFKGILGMEHGNALSGKEGEIALIEAYKQSDIL